jgi:hypothetical protein
MDISFHPPPDPDERRSLRAVMPWWRRLFAWLSDFHRFATTLIAVAGTTIAVHVWLKGLITRAEMDLAVEAAVTKATEKALLEVRGDLAIIKTNTGGLPEWRGDTSKRVISLEEKVSSASKDAQKANDRLDTYLINARGSR